MRRMFSEKQIKGIVQDSSSEVVEALKGQDISVEGITSKGIANTGNIANIGDVAISGDLSATGDVKAFENIVDSQGHNRFIEGNLTLAEIEGVTQTYGKWSLSGTHLMIVLAGNMANETVIDYTGTWCDLANSVPKWIKDKIVPQPAFSNTYIDSKSMILKASDGSDQTTSAILRKDGSSLWITLYAVTLTKDRSFRLSFDLLIDNESEE